MGSQPSRARALPRYLTRSLSVSLVEAIAPGATKLSLTPLLPLMSAALKSISRPVTARPNCQL